MSRFNNPPRTARVKHNACRYCRKPIQPGEQYITLYSGRHPIDNAHESCAKEAESQKLGLTPIKED